MPRQQNNTKTSLTSQPLPPALPSQPNAGKSHRGLALVLASWLIFGGLLIILIVNQQKIFDWWRLRGYQPSSAIQQLAEQDTMTDYTKHLFYLNRPQLLSSVNTFRKDCPENKDTIVLGCYHPVQNGIYVYNVKDPALQGVSQVTAAHEALHAIYDRLSDKDRKHVNGLLEDYYKHGLTNQRVKDEIKIYQKTEPDAVLDEMHSTFGTEIADLPPALEAYYKQYFSNRAAVVAYGKKYEQAFSARQSTIMKDDAQLTKMKAQIDSQQTALNAQLVQVKATRSRLDGLLAAGQTQTYNNEVVSYNGQVSDYNANVASLRTAIESYNQLITARNLVAGELTTLDKALDTRLPQQTTR